MTARRHMSVKIKAAVAGTAGFAPNVTFIVRIMKSSYVRSYPLHLMFVILAQAKGTVH